MAHDDPFAGQTVDADWAYYLDTAGTYTPTLIAAGGSNPVLGDDGFINGRWHRSGHLITAWGDTLLDGTGASLGSTSWRVSLPFDADVSLHSAGVLNAGSDCIGNAFFRSGTSAESIHAVVLLSAAAELIFYESGSNSSIGASDLTLPVRLKWTVHYVADPSDLPT